MSCWKKLALMALALAAVATPAATAYPYRGGYYRPYYGGYYRPYYYGYGYPAVGVGVVIVPRPVVVVPEPVIVAQPGYAPAAPPPPLNLTPVQPIPSTAPAPLRVAPIPEPNVPPVP